MEPKTYEELTRHGVGKYLTKTPEGWRNEILNRFNTHIYNCIKCLRYECGLSETNGKCVVAENLNQQISNIERSMNYQNA